MADYGEMFYGTLPQDTQDMDAVLRGVGRSIRDIGRSTQYLPYDVLGAPVDIATMAMRPFGYETQQPVGGSDWLIEMSRRMGIADRPTGSGLETATRFATGVPSPVAIPRALAGIGRFVDMLKETPPTGAVTMGSKSAELSALKTRLDELNNQFATDTAPPSAVREHGAVMKRYQELQDELFPRAQTTPAEVADETAQGLLDTSYRGGHSAPSREFGAQLHQLDQIFPDDIYSPQAARNYGHYGGNDPMDRQTMRLAQSLRGKPDADVTIYRAVPKDEKIKDINQGDWVTINKQYAKEHGESVLLGDYKILEKKVKAKDIWTNADSIHEYGYDPEISDPQMAGLLDQPAQSVVENSFQTAFTQVSPGDEVAGLTVRKHIPNMDSIGASLDNYEVLSGIRKVPAKAFDAEYLDSLKARGLDKRTADLSEEIKQSKEINPLIVAVDSKGAYIIEGGHRFDALMTQGRDSVPAKVVIDQDDPPTEDFLRSLFQ